MSLRPASLRLASLLLFCLVLHSALALKLCSFNVRSFGERKKENHNAMDVIVKVSCVRVLDSLHLFPSVRLKGPEICFQDEVRTAVTSSDQVVFQASAVV